jgi:hypothetical protein
MKRGMWVQPAAVVIWGDARLFEERHRIPYLILWVVVKDAVTVDGIRFLQRECQRKVARPVNVRNIAIG